jgi:hypothetical protein
MNELPGYDDWLDNHGNPGIWEPEFESVEVNDEGVIVHADIISAYPDGYDFIQCPYCDAQIWGTPDNIDSGLRKHIEYCKERPEDENDN